MLNPAEEFAYNPRVHELFADMRHAGGLTSTGKVYDAVVGSFAQGARINLQIELQGGAIQTVRYQAYGCPHFLAASESLARWLEGRAVSELPQWRWRDMETELQVPIAKRARLLLLEDALRALQDKVNDSPAVPGIG